MKRACKNIDANLLIALGAVVLLSISTAQAQDNLPADRSAAESLFEKQIAPIFEQNCISCHNPTKRKGKLALHDAASAFKGGASGKIIAPGNPDDSELIYAVSGKKPEMPKQSPPLSAKQIEALRLWIKQGAVWPKDRVLKEARPPAGDWWSLKPLQPSAVPKLPAAFAAEYANRIRTPIDAYVLAQLAARGLTPSPQADRRTLIRRLYFDLTGLPPTPRQIADFIADADPNAYEKLVERLLASPRHGERWARHWLDVVHYGDTHGYDKDKVRPHAWPYRDYVIRSFNQDKPFNRFVLEQLAGDVLFGDTPDGIIATGFIAAGPWDFVGHVELPESKKDGKIARNLDRDDMVATTMNSFVSLTVQCARCHSHKFDPIAQEDYYSLQAVFAAVDRANRPYQVDDEAAAAKRSKLQDQRAELLKQRQRLRARIAKSAGPKLAPTRQRITELTKKSTGPARPEFGYHSGIVRKQNVVKWVQVDLGKPTLIRRVVIVACHDNYNNIGAGFGFPLRYRIEVSDDPNFAKGVTVIADHTGQDVPNPGVTPLSTPAQGKTARYVRVTATKLAMRRNDYIFALGELAVLTPDGKNAARGAKVTSRDSIEAPVRWRRTNLVDGYYYRAKSLDHLPELADLIEQRKQMLAKAITPQVRTEQVTLHRQLTQIEKQLSVQPKAQLVYAAATTFKSPGNFKATGGKPRAIHLLNRGDISQPKQPTAPGALNCLPQLPGKFDLPESHKEGDRRVALARWIIDQRNPLTWRSIVNRIWQYHFGRGIAETPNDFGRMGSPPSHPRLLDYLAVWFRDNGQSIKKLHRMIVLSSTYQQASVHDESNAKIDGANQFLWRANRRRLEAEAIRDAVLSVSGKLDLTMGGPGFRLFGFKDDHSPHYKYHEYDPDDPKSHRRSVYRFIVRSAPDPFMATLDCADPSQQVARRNQTITPLQALALLNNKFMVRMAEHFATRVKDAGDLPAQIRLAVQLALGRDPSDAEIKAFGAYAREHGMANTCRVILNANEFVFID